MLKRMTVVLVVCACVGVAYGGANKIKSFTPEGSENSEADGMAILNYAADDDKTIFQLIVSDFTPSLTYSVRLMDGASEAVVVDAFTTNDHGHANFHHEFPGDISTYDVELFVGTTGSGVVWSQLQDPPNLPNPYANPSNVDTEYPDQLTRAADNIQFDWAQEITAIRWWGIWCNALPLAEEFRIRFYTDAGGQPSATYVEEDLVLTEKGDGVTPPVTVCTAPPGGLLEYMFEADLANPFTAAASTAYWVEVVGYIADSAVFMWSNTSSTITGFEGGVQWRYSPSPARWLTGYPDRAFELIGETGTTELRASGDNPAGG